MKKLLLVLILGLGLQPVYAQKIIPKFLRRMLFEKDSSRRSSFFVLPVLSSAPETGLEAGGSALYSFYTDTMRNSGTRVSNVFGYATVTTKGQSRFSLSTNYWTPQNRYHYTALISYINFPFDFFGIGNETQKANLDRLGQQRLRINLAAEKRLGNNLYLGIIAGAQHFKYEDKEPGGIYETLPRSAQPEGGTLLLAGPSIVFDSRNNNTYTTRGLLVKTYFNVLKGLYSSNDYRGGLFNIELSHFTTLSKRLVLGINAQEQSLVGGRTPFFLLPALGNDELMRGYYNGRFRDKNLIAAQTELRYRINDRLGIVGFAGAGEVFRNSFDFSSLKPSYGLGGRYFFDVEKGLSMRVDYAFGEQRPGEKRQSGLYLSLGEAF